MSVIKNRFCVIEKLNFTYKQVCQLVLCAIECAKKSGERGVNEKRPYCEWEMRANEIQKA